MDDAVCSPVEPALCVGKRYSTEARRPSLGLCPQSPRDLWVHTPANMASDVLFAFAEIRTYPTPCCLDNGHIGLIASCLFEVLSHRLRMRCLPPIG